MNAFMLLGIAVAVSAATLILRTIRPELSSQIGIAAGVFILMFTVSELLPVLDFIKTLSERFGFEIKYIAITIKIIGIAYLVQFAASICRDAGESAVAGKIELAGRAIIIVLCLPMILAVVDMIAAIVPST